MTKRCDIQKILVIGSGPIVVGQAAEFDYSGSQAAIALKEEGYEVVLVNSNPATIMTDKETADKVYIEPLTLASLQTIIQQEKPDALLPTLGGQTGLNMAKELAESGVLDEYNVELIGTKLSAIEAAEDREQFRDLMTELGEPVPASAIAVTVAEAVQFADAQGYPVIVRPAYTLGGSGGGIAQNQAELVQITQHGLDLSPVTQVLIEESIAGYKEIEFEVMRDTKDNALIVASMENFDPVGIHTGDSIVVAPVQTLSDVDYQMLRDAALKIIRALDIAGGVNIQMALAPDSDKYAIIEVNPRVSRSSALASKATGYPIAKMAAKIAIGLSLDEIKNPVTKTTLADFEPALDYVIVKIPRWPFDKFKTANRQLGTQMKATGEVMAIGRNLEEALLKAVRSLEIGVTGLNDVQFEAWTTSDLLAHLWPARDDRLFMLAELLRRGVTATELHDATQIDDYFLDKLVNIVTLAQQLQQAPGDSAMLALAKRRGFADATIAKLWQWTSDDVWQLRIDHDIKPVYKMVDTVAGEFDAVTPYYYATYGKENEARVTQRPSVLVIGSGPIRIGQGVEFDYATVHAVKAIQSAGYEAIVMNSNPETVSTDFSISDKLYFEPLTFEDVREVVALEQPVGVIVQFGGQTAINLAADLEKHGINILGTSVADLNRAEDRASFNQVIEKLQLPQPIGQTATTVKEAVKIAKSIGYPVLIRPSYVLGGRAMEIVTNESALADYMSRAVAVSHDHPVLIDQYVVGMEAELDVLSDGETVVTPGVMEHIEPAGIHSGDSMSVYPPQVLSESLQAKMITAATALARELQIVGLLNVQFVIQDDTAYVIEVNPRASRTVPFISKVTDVPLAQLATQVMLGTKLADLGYQDGVQQLPTTVAVKAPVFSFSKLPGVTQLLGPEMKSTGEAMGRAETFDAALYKTFTSAGITVPATPGVAVVLTDDDQEAAALDLAFVNAGFKTRRRCDRVEQGDVLIDTRKTPVASPQADQQMTLWHDAMNKQLPVFTSAATAYAFLQAYQSQNE